MYHLPPGQSIFRPFHSTITRMKDMHNNISCSDWPHLYISFLKKSFEIPKGEQIFLCTIIGNIFKKLGQNIIITAGVVAVYKRSFHIVAC